MAAFNVFSHSRLGLELFQIVYTVDTVCFSESEPARPGARPLPLELPLGEARQEAVPGPVQPRPAPLQVSCDWCRAGHRSRDHGAPRQRGHLLLRLLPRPDGGAVRVGAVPRLRDDPQLLAPLRDLPHQVPELLGQHQHTPGRGGRKNVARVDIYSFLFIFSKIFICVKSVCFKCCQIFCLL